MAATDVFLEIKWQVRSTVTNESKRRSPEGKNNVLRLSRTTHSASATLSTPSVAIPAGNYM
jgi:hypothetical protein